MEAGNLIFGHSRGRFEVPREDAWHDPLTALLDALDLGGYGEPGFDDGTLAIRPYFWGDCECGFQERWDAKDELWCAENRHAPTCYQTELRTREEAYDRESGYTAIHDAAFGERERHVGPLLAGFVTDMTDHGNGALSMAMMPREDQAMEDWRRADSIRRAFVERLYAELGAKYDRDPQFGAAVHCTCDYKTKRAAWCATDDHAATCGIVAPNLSWKPADFELRWYKYPLRDSYMSHDLKLEDWTVMFASMLTHVSERRH